MPCLMQKGASLAGVGRRSYLLPRFDRLRVGVDCAASQLSSAVQYTLRRSRFSVQQATEQQTSERSNLHQRAKTALNEVQNTKKLLETVPK